MPRRFAPRNDRQKFALCPRLPGGTAGKRSCTRRNASVFSMSLRTSAHTGVAIRIPAGKPSKLVLLQANPYALFRIRPKYYFLLCPAARRCGLPRRFAPRNDMQKHAACQHGNDVVPGEFAALFRIRPKYYFLLCSAARRCGLPRPFAPRNDMLKLARCPHSTRVLPG